MTEFVREASQRRLASQTHKHDPDPHEERGPSTKADNSAETNVQTVLGTSKTIAVNELCASTGIADQKHFPLHAQPKIDLAVAYFQPKRSEI